MVDISKIGHYYIGETSQPYFKYLQDVNAINITHIMDDYDKYAKQIKEIGRGKESELLQEIKIMNIFTDISEKQAKNIFKFFHSLDKDQYTAYVLDLMKKDVDTLEHTENFQLFRKEFKEINDKIKQFHNVATSIK